MGRQGERFFYSERYSNTDLGRHARRIPDFALLADGMLAADVRGEGRGR